MGRDLLFVLGLLVLSSLYGCGSAPETKAAPPKKKTKKSEPVKLDIKPVEVSAGEFPSVAAALEELERVLKMPDGEDRNRAEIRVQKWLVLQGDKAVPEVAAKATSKSESLETRITTCRILGKLGPAAEKPLMTIIDEAESNQLRRKAIQTLGSLEKPTPAIIDKLIALLDDKDTQALQYAIDALKAIGPPAKAAAGKLSDLRQKHSEEQIRVAAGEALKKVEPRKTLTPQ
jgi:HEAT repeat protein